MLDFNLREGHYDSEIGMYFSKWDDRIGLFNMIVIFLSELLTVVLIILQACNVIKIGWWWPFSPLVFSLVLVFLTTMPLVLFEKE